MQRCSVNDSVDTAHGPYYHCLVLDPTYYSGFWPRNTIESKHFVH
jgi:hypothetical protein